MSAARFRGMHRARLTLLALSSSLSTAACSDDEFDLITRITEPRTIAVLSEPTVLSVDGEIHLDPITVDPLGVRGRPGAPADARPVAAIRLRACTPWIFFADPATDCAGADSMPLTAAADGRFVMPTQALLAAFPPPQLGGSRPATADDLRLALAAGIELRIPVIAEVDVDGQTLIARRDIHIAESVGTLQNPRIAGARFDAEPVTELRAGQRYVLSVAFDRDSLDPSPADRGPPDSLEEIDCNLYSTAGQLSDREVDVDRPDRDTPFPETERTTFTAGAPGGSWLYIVGTDDTGGMSFAAVPLTTND